MKQNLLLLAVSILGSLLLLEAGIGLGARVGLFPIKIPTYSLQQVRSSIFWRDVNPDFGVWHPPYSSTRHTKSCFDVTYRSNSHGARDRERTLQSDRRRIVVLGDSMTEGFGVDDAQRFTSVLERETGIEHLNFGTSGSFGTIQYWLLYKTLASKFSHSAVVIGMIPENEFWENDYEYGKQVYSERYRPYLTGEYPNYRLVYYRDTLEQSMYRDRGGWLGFAQRLLAEFTYSYNALAYFKQLIAVRANPAATKDHTAREKEFFKASPSVTDAAKPYSGFYDFRKDQLDIVKYTLEQIKQLAGDRQVVIALLPSRASFRRYDPAAPVTPLAAELGRFAEANGIQLVDLLPDIYRHATDWNSLILPCDGHWNSQGHAAAAQYLRAALTPLYRKLAQ
jgi:hypothetical protein